MMKYFKNDNIGEYDYPLPADRIALHPLGQRDASRLLVYKNGRISDDHFMNLPNHLSQTTLVMNNTRVIEARILFQKSTGAHIEIFCLEPHEESIEQSLHKKGSVKWNCLIGGASKWKRGMVLQKNITVNELDTVLSAHYIEKSGDSFVIEFTWEPAAASFAEIIHVAGDIPLPPYIKRKTNEEDKERYQTIFSRQEGSVAAPTAALHFSPASFEALKEKNNSVLFITLHVGAGTFKPVKTERFSEHSMHAEPFSVNREVLQKLIESDNIIAVGTTSLRSLESLHWIGLKRMMSSAEDWTLRQWEAYDLDAKYPGVDYKKTFAALVTWMDENDQHMLHCSTSLMIVPGYRFSIPVGLVTNFHQPQSTLLLLVSAFIGEDWKQVYQHALDHQYRFLSYGDSSLLWRK